MPGAGGGGRWLVRGSRDLRDGLTAGRGLGPAVRRGRPAGLQSCAGRRAGAPGRRPEHSPSSEEKEAEVSMALGKSSSIFRPSSMVRRGRGDLRGRRTTLLAPAPSGRGRRGSPG